MFERLRGLYTRLLRQSAQAEPPREPASAEGTSGLTDPGVDTDLASLKRAWTANVCAARPKDVSKRIAWVAEAIAERSEFRRRAAEVAEEGGAVWVEPLSLLFHGDPEPPRHLADRFPGLGSWLSARQFAIFEIYYNIGAPALPVLRRVAFGPYDWTQGNAIEVLCRFAADGIETERIVGELKAAFPAMRFEALLYAAGPLIHQAATNDSLKSVIDELLEVPEFREAWEELNNSDA